MTTDAALICRARFPSVRVAVAAMILVAAPIGAAVADTVQKAGTPQVPAAQDAPQAASKPPQIGVPPARNLLIMIRTTLVALHHANITNNYSVLRDLGAPSFQQVNSVERLSAAFANLRKRGNNIAAVVLALPTLSQPAAIDQNGMLRLTGTFDTKPSELAFDLAFQVVDGFWRLDGIAVQFRAPPPPQAGEAPDTKGPSTSSASDKKSNAKAAKKQPKL